LRSVLVCCLLLIAGPLLAADVGEPRILGRLQLLTADSGGLTVDSAEIGVAGALRVDLSYQLRWELGDASGRVRPRALRLAWRPDRNLRVRAGLFRAPYGRQAQISGKRLQAIDRSAAVGDFVPGRDLGAAVDWTLAGGRLNLAAGLFNGTGASLDGDDARARPLRTLRLVWRLGGGVGGAESDLEGVQRPRLSLGLGVADSEDAGATDDVYPRTIAGRRESAGLDAALCWRGLYAAAEAHRAWFDPDVGVDFAAEGLALQAGWYLPGPRLEPRIAWDRFDRDRALPGDAERTWTWGLNWYPDGRRTMFRLEYVDRRAPRPGAEDWRDDALRLQAQLLFG
jgi:hypothetical protein